MKLLYVTEEVPNRDPVHGNGSSMIPYEVICHLPEDVGITLLTFRGETAVPAVVQARCAEVVVLEPRRRWSALTRSLFTRLSPGAAARTSRQADHSVADLSARSDVTLLHGPHVSPLARAVQGPLVLQVVDPWSLRVAMEAASARKLRATYRRRKARQALAEERALPRRARLLTVGQQDATTWSAQVGRPVRSIANGVSAVDLEVPAPPIPTVSFVGSLSYQPNVESASVLVQDIGPRLRARVPSLRIVIAGRQPSAKVLALASDWVEVRANVPSVSEVFLSSTVAVFADRRGLGIRNSVKEALAAGVPVVASASAAREQDPHPLLTVASDEDELVELVVAALEATGAPRRAATKPSQLRTWADVAADYFCECRLAAEPSQAAPPSPEVPLDDVI